MDKFTISDLERFSGIKAHTIRIWEQRYNTLQPDRSEGNTRSYNGRQLRRLLNIVTLLEDGKKISELSSLSDQELFKSIEQKLSRETDAYDSFIFQFLSAAMDYDETYFDKLFASCVLKFGLKNTYKFIIYPLLNRIGIMWMGDLLSPAKEHFVSNLFRQKFFSAIDALPPVNQGAKKWVLFLPEDEFHEIGLLFANYFIRQSGKQVLYLGPNVPLSTLNDVINEVNPSHLYFFLIRKNNRNIHKKTFTTLAKQFPKIKIHFSDNRDVAKEITSRSLNYISTIEDLEIQLK